MISSGTSMGETLYKITSSKKRNLSESNSYSTSFPVYHSQERFHNNNNIKKTNLSSIVNLIKQSNLKKDNRMLFDKNYYFNLIKIKLKKNYKNKKFPPINTFTPNNKISSVNYKMNNILTDINILKNKYIKTISYKSLNHKKKKRNLYKNIFNQNPQNLKIVYVNKFMTSKNSLNNKTVENFKTNENIKVKNKIIPKNYNIDLSKLRFMMFHGFNKKNINNDYNYNSMEKYTNKKYEGFDNKKIRQLFLKNKLKKVNTKMKLVQKNVESTKAELNILFSSLNKDIQLDLNEEYKKT